MSDTAPQPAIDTPAQPSTAAKKQKIYTWAVFVGIAVGIFAALASHEKLGDLEAKTYDARLRFAAWAKPVPDVSRTVLAPIDDNAVARYGRWPWSRDRWAPILRSLAELGVKLVSFDVEFPEKSEPVLRRSVTGVSFQKLIEREIDSLDVQITPELLLNQFAEPVDLAIQFADDALQSALRTPVPALAEHVVDWLAQPVAPATLVRLAKLPLGFLAAPVVLDRARPEAAFQRAEHLKALAAAALEFPAAERATKVKYGTAPDELALKVMLANPGILQTDPKFAEAGLTGDAFDAKHDARQAFADAALDQVFAKGPQLLASDVKASLAATMGIDRSNVVAYEANLVAARARALVRAQVQYPIQGLLPYLDGLMRPAIEGAMEEHGQEVAPERLAASAATTQARSQPLLPFSRVNSMVGLAVKEHLDPAARTLSARLNESTQGLRRLMNRAVRNPDDDLAMAIRVAKQAGMLVCGVFYTSGGLNLADSHKESATDEFIRTLLSRPVADRLTLVHSGQMEEASRRILRGFTVNPAAAPDDPMWTEKLGFMSLEDLSYRKTETSASPAASPAPGVSPAPGAPSASAAPAATKSAHAAAPTAAQAQADEFLADLESSREQVLNQALDLELAGRPDLADTDLLEALARRFGAPLNEYLTITVTKLVPPARARALSMKRFLIAAESDPLTDSPRFYGFTPPILDIARAYAGLALSVMAADGDGVMRRVPLVRRVGEGMLPGMSFMMFLHAIGVRLDDREALQKAVSVRPGPVVHVEGDGGALDIPVDTRGSMLLRMQGTELKLDRLGLSTVINYIRLKNERLEIQKNANPQEADAFNALEEAIDELVRLDDIAPVTLGDLEKRAAQVGSFEIKIIKDRIEGDESQGARAPLEWQRLAEVWRERAFESYKKALAQRAANFRKLKPADREAKLKRNPKAWGAILAQSDLLEELEFVKKELKSRLDGKMVIIGAAQTGNTDSAPTPFTSKDPNYALHAHGAATLLSGEFIRRPSHRDATLIPIVVLAIAVGLVLPRVPMLFGALWTLALIALWCGLAACLLAYRGVWVDVVSPCVSVSMSYLLLSAWRYGTVERSKQVYRDMFKAYLDERVIEQFVERPELFKEIGGISMEITAFFSDIEGFTTISETLSPEALSKMLEDYLTPMTDIIQGRGGLRDKYIGDAIVAMFGAPVHVPDHAIQGCLASLEQKERLAALKKDDRLLNDPKSWLSVLRSKGRDFNARMGVNTGLAKVGNFGSSKSKNYTMIGDTVNLAARLEGANKAFGTYLMISEFTYAQAREYIEARPLDSIRVKGKLRPVTVYELMAKKGKLTQLQEDVRGIYVAARELYLQQRFTDAIAKFQEALKLDPTDPPCLTLMHRSEHFIEEPPAKDWDGTYDLKEK